MAANCKNRATPLKGITLSLDRCPLRFFTNLPVWKSKDTGDPGFTYQPSFSSRYYQGDLSWQYVKDRYDATKNTPWGSKKKGRG